MNKLHDLLNKIRPLINASGLEKAAKLPKNALGKHYRWADGKPNGQACHQKHFPAIVRALCAVFGVIEIDGWRITCDPESPAIFAIRPIPNREAETVEVDGGFQYLHPEWRQVYDDFDFSQYFSG
jgi:hypothetical protein